MMYRILFQVILCLTLLSSIAKAEVNVVASIKPIHSLVSSVMAGVGTPYLIIKTTASPHTYSMKPSDAKAIEKADIIFWISENLETALKRPVQTLGDKAKNIQLWKAPGLALLEYRADREWTSHTHHKHHHHDSVSDMHIWMSPTNAVVIVKEVARQLVLLDPENKEAYEKNSLQTIKKLTVLSNSLQKQLHPYRQAPFIVFHDSYQYLEAAMNLNAAGSVTINPESQLGARGLMKLGRYIKKKNIRCLFSEPQFNASLTKRLAENLKVKTAVLDPIGASIKDGPDLYFTMMQQNADALAGCLK